MRTYMTLLATVLSASFLLKTSVPVKPPRSSSAMMGVVQSTQQPATILGFTKQGELEMRLVDDDKWAILTIVGEALSEPIAGKVAVGEVIRNRMKRKYKSDGTLIGTVFHPLQFSMWDDRARILAANADDDNPRVKECAEAWKLSAESNITNGAVLYHTTMITPPYWASAPSVTKVVTINRHIFYKDGKGA